MLVHLPSGIQRKHNGDHGCHPEISCFEIGAIDRLDEIHTTSFGGCLSFQSSSSSDSCLTDTHPLVSINFDFVRRMSSPKSSTRKRIVNVATFIRAPPGIKRPHARDA